MNLDFLKIFLPILMLAPKRNKAAMSTKISTPSPAPVGGPENKNTVSPMIARALRMRTTFNALKI